MLCSVVLFDLSFSERRCVMGKVKSAWMAEREVEKAMGWVDDVGLGVKKGWTDSHTNNATQTRYMKQNTDPYNLWDNDDRGDALITDTDLGALMARWEEL